MRPDKLEKVRERLETMEGAILVVKPEADGKICVTSRRCNEAKAFLKNEAFEVRYVDGRRHVAVRMCNPSEDDLLTETYDP